MKKGIIKQVSMECDYAEGECSVCGKRVKSKAEYCIHLKKFKGAEFKGKPVCEILHGITFTGLGLLDRKGADEKARITQVASDASSPHEGGAKTMADDKDKEQDEAVDQDGAKKRAPAGGGTDAAKDARIKELEGENQKLKAQLAELQKELETLRAKEKAAANRARAEKLMQTLEKEGFCFGEEAEREKELQRLAGLSDEAFEATEAAYKRAPKPEAEAPKKEEDDDEDKDEKKGKDKKGKPDAEAEAEGKLRTDAGVKPLVVDDKKVSLEDRLKKGVMAAYEERVGAGV
jgi:adenine-specific DNA-methyltransferase